jgi:hypothetical protein
MKMRAQARQRMHLGAMIMAAILSLLGAQQLRLEPSGTIFLAGDVLPASIAP